MSLHLWCDLPGPWHLRRAGPALGSDTYVMNLHLAEISEAVAPGAHAVIIMDQAGCHTTPKLVVPENITIMALPSKSPELNQVENTCPICALGWQCRIFSMRAASICAVEVVAASADGSGVTGPRDRDRYGSGLKAAVYPIDKTERLRIHAGALRGRA